LSKKLYKNISYLKRFVRKLRPKLIDQIETKADFFDETVDSRLWSLFDAVPVVSSHSCGNNETRWVGAMRFSTKNISFAIIKGVSLWNK
jgi:hypothetical protein